MTITTPSRMPAVKALGRRRSAKGFTLVELIVSSGIGAVIMIGVLSSFLFIGRSAYNMAYYTEMEAQARKMLEYFAEDARQASSATWNSSVSVTLVVNTQQVTYAYNSGTGVFTRTKTGSPTVSVTGVTTFQFTAYTINGSQITDFSTAAARTAAGVDTKQVQISLSAARNRATLATSTSTVLSARFILRNKKVTA